ncbi:DHA2 family efflux MFS transporter permease subunit [Frankia sp. Ag45/Mut15]|uniref:DHA2 family efflux MFS transporter permease subunit n=1 Tax=Frankia umida TaxID=573489 RepID=A0ABT0JZJ7_9ACTN|nr:DHA2 family efflux MFS transporter permease subunit [Frankia umida]MCK9876961.1 DHA2 family efflux MFS transporter permease subunit [Frankia umida]
MLQQIEAEPARPEPVVDTRRLIIALLFGAVLPLLDATIVNVAIDRLSLTFDTALSTTQWVVTGYAMAAAIAIPATGWGVARFGGRKVWMTALGVFLVGSVLCGLAWNVESLIAFRILQGIGGGMTMPVLQTVLIGAVGPEGARRAMATIGIPAVVAPVVGPAVGGLVLAHLSWRWIFFVNVPICLIALLLAATTLPRDTPTHRGSLDVKGLLLLSPALALLVYGLSVTGGPDGDTMRAMSTILAGAVLLAGFIRHALRVPAPMVDVRLFARPTFASAGALMLFAGIYFYGALILLPLYYQRVLGYSTLATGAVLGLQGIGALLARSASGGLTSRLGVRTVVLAGLGLAVLGTLPFVATHGDPNPYLLGAALVIRGAGVGIVTVLILGAAYHGIDRAQISHASSASRILLQLGAALGIALVSAVLEWQLNSIDDGNGAAAIQPAFGHTSWLLIASALAGVIPALLLPAKAATHA